jgi:hypothetical protein
MKRMETMKIFPLGVLQAFMRFMFQALTYFVV